MNMLLILVVLAVVPAAFATYVFPDSMAPFLSQDYHTNWDYNLKVIKTRQNMGLLIDKCTRHLKHYGRFIIFTPPAGLHPRLKMKKSVRTYGYFCDDISKPVEAKRLGIDYYISDLADEDFMELRRVWKDLPKLYEMETPLLTDCYHDKGWFWECVVSIRLRYIGIGYGESFDRMKTLWQDLQKANLRQVEHCLLYHQEDNPPECKGFTYDRPEPKLNYQMNDRDNFRVFVWNKYVSHIRQQSKDTGKGLVTSCFFERAINATRFASNFESKCKILSHNVKNSTEKPTPAELAKYKEEIAMYDEGAEILKAEDCNLYHKEEKLMRCKHFSWNDYNTSTPEFLSKTAWTGIWHVENKQYFQPLPKISIPPIPDYPKWSIPEPK